MSVTVAELTPTTGVQITGLSGHRLVDKAVAEECRLALDRRGVVVYREADISDSDLVVFNAAAGPGRADSERRRARAPRGAGDHP